MSTKSKNAYNVAGIGISVHPGEMVRTLRALKGWSQMDLSRATGISQANLSAIENGRVDLGKQRAIILAEALHVHPASIMFSDYESVA